MIQVAGLCLYEPVKVVVAVQLAIEVTVLDYEEAAAVVLEQVQLSAELVMEVVGVEQHSVVTVACTVEVLTDALQ